MAGSVIFSYELSPEANVVKLIYQCTSDGSGNVSSPTFTQQGDLAYFQPYSLLTGVIGQVRIIPGSSSVQPTDAYAVQLRSISDSTLDFLCGMGASCSQTNAKLDIPQTTTNGAGVALFHDILVPYATGVGASKGFTLHVYLWIKGK